MQPGQDLLHYHLTEKLGEGGMGVVWKATDTTLGREVAIKILPPDFAADEERLARFDREARLLASLNHPNIAGIYGIHKAPASEGRPETHFLAMELVAGADLSQRLLSGPLAMEEALRTAREIATGVEAAHENGVIHRDLKPANVKLTTDGKAKVLDFGLAKAADAAAAASGDPSFSPTMTSAGTQAGMILGTASYMSPEQAAGQPTDRRCDVWSFGVVLHELLTGKRLFDGETVSHTLAAVLRAEVDLADLPKQTPARVEVLIRRCLERDPMRRLRDIGEARIALEQVEAGDTDGVEDTAVAKATRGSRRVMPWLGLGLVVGIALGWAFVSLRDSPPVEAESGNAVRFSIRASAGNREIGNHVPAADDRYVVYEGSVDGVPWLFLHDFASGAVRRLEQTSGAVGPFLSPDGRWVGFHRGTDLMKLRLAGGDAVKICDVASGNPGADWGADGTILFPRGWLQGLWTVSADGGEPVALTEVNAEAGEKGHWWPRFLPDGRHALFTIWNVGAGLIDADVALLDVASGEYRTLVPGADAHFLPPGQIVFYRAGSYHAIDFDPVTLEVAGDPLPVLESATDPAPQGTSDLGLAISHRGTLFYNTRQVYPASRLAIVEPGAAPRVLPFPSRSMISMSLSPDGRSLIVASLESGLHVLRMLDLQNGTDERIALSGSNWEPHWKPDGSGFAFLSIRKGDFDVYFKDAGTGGPETPIQVTPTDEQPVGWTADGSAVFVRETSDATRVLKAVPVDGSGGEATTIGNINANVASVSPHGDWLVYDSMRAGTRNIYVRPYPGPGPEVRISPRGGRQVAWSLDGTELYYAREDSIVAVSYTVEDGRFQPGKEEVIFQSPLLAQAIIGTPLAVLGRRRFVVALVESEPGTPQLEVVLNWNREVRERLAAGTER